MKLIGSLLLLGLLSLVEGELSPNFGNCRQFFVNNHAPTILPNANRYRQICQRFSPNPNPIPPYRYATLYDTVSRIPVYSAYRYPAGQRGHMPTNTWMIEPPLDNGVGVDMRTKTAAGLAGQVLGNQADNTDYAAPFDRGHLYPRDHNTIHDQARSTYTLTNAAPQYHEENVHWFRQVESEIAADISSFCDPQQVYMVAGVAPSITPVNTINNGRVNVPEYFWSAYCCRNNVGAYRFKGIIMHMPKGQAYAAARAAGQTPQQAAQVAQAEPLPYPLTFGNGHAGEFNRELTTLYSGVPFAVFGTQPGCS